MSIFRKIAPAAALLAMIFIVPAPAAQSMILNTNDGGSGITPKPVKIEKLSDTPLSTNTSPTIIKNTVHLAWISGELKWSSKSEWKCYNQIIDHESSWNPWADNGAGWEETGGIPQAHPSSKMAEAGKDYRTNAWTQVRWGLNYISSAYGSPCEAWSAWQSRAANGSYGWY
jgi:hypothetical protein